MGIRVHNCGQKKSSSKKVSNFADLFCFNSSTILGSIEEVSSQEL